MIAFRQNASSTPYSKAGSVTVTHKNKLVATIDISIQPTPFSQPTFDRYTQKAIAAGHNFQKAYREGAYGNTTKPFIGLITLLTGTPSPPRPANLSRFLWTYDDGTLVRRVYFF